VRVKPDSAAEFGAFTEFLKKKGLKLTEQRRMVLTRALAEPKHFSAEQLLADLRRDDASVSKATVYRTLALLVEAHLLDSVDFERGHVLYERAHDGEDHHDHLICTGCGRIVEFHDETLEAAQNAVARQNAFEVLWHVHKLYGRCSDCRKKGEAGKQPARASTTPARPRRSR
jgi:Fur family ferric uptake transcriptional regulator